MSAPRRLLVISYHYPPDGAIGGMRWAGLTRHLAPLGWHSRVITAAQQSGSLGHAGVTTISSPRRATLNDVYKRWRRHRANGLGSAGGNGRAAAGGAGESWLARLRFEAGMLLALPDDARGWILRTAWRARQEIARARPDVVISSGPPHSAHLAAWLATRGSHVPWLADLRDPWAGPLTDAWRSSAHYRSGLARWLIPRLERLVIDTADGVLCNTREFAAALRALHPAARVHWLPNGVDRAALPAADTVGPLLPGLGVAHVGTLYGGRSLEPVLHALRALLDAHPEALHDGTRLRLAGLVEESSHHRLPREIARYRLEPYVEHFGVLPREEALRLARRSRLAVVLAQEQDLQVPAKLYELVAMGVPTLVIAGANSAAAAEARRIGAMTQEPQEIAAIRDVMVTCWRSRPVGGDAPARLEYRELACDVDQLCREIR